MQKRYIMLCQDDINTEHNMKSVGRAAVAQWTQINIKIYASRIWTRVCPLRQAHCAQYLCRPWQWQPIIDSAFAFITVEYCVNW